MDDLTLNADKLYRALGMAVALIIKPRAGSSIPGDAAVWAGLIKTFAELNEFELNAIMALESKPNHQEAL